MSPDEEAYDWEVTDEGLYIATRGVLIRRGYCCANQCRNCPYINWRHQSTWRPAPAERVRRTRVSLKAIVGARALLSQHEQQLQHCAPAEQDYHRAMIEHYCTLLERWSGEPI